MLQYVDSFFCACSPQKKTFVLRLRQEEPMENKDTGEVEVQNTEVVNVIMEQECAKQLADSILQLIDNNAESTSEN